MLFRKISLLLLLLLPNMVLCSFWSLQNLSVSSQGDKLQLRLTSLKLSDIDEEITDIFYQCKGSLSIYPLHNCSSGTVSFKYNDKSYNLGVRGWINLQTNKWKLVISNMDEKVQFYLDSKNKDKLSIKFQKLQIKTLTKFINQYTNIEEIVAEGLLTANIRVDFEDLLKIHAVYSMEQLSWESKTGEYVLAGTNHQGEIEVIQSSTGVDLKALNQLTKGEGLFKDLYVLFDENPLTAQLNIDFDQQLQPNSANLTLNSTSAIEFKIVLDDWYKNDVQIEYTINNLSQFYQGFVASYFEILGVNDLSLSGQSQGFLSVKNDKIVTANLAFTGLDLDMPSKKIQMQKVNAQLNWNVSGKRKISTVSWDKLLLAGMPVKQSWLSFSSVGQQLTLQKNTEIPIFDGSILIHELSMKELFKPQINIEFDGQVNPISIALITEKMGWPIMQGSISGKIPAMKKVGSSITFDGSLDLKIFDGQMQINNLSTERLFGIAPVIAADIQFQQLNLQQITSTFDFGEITGLVEGKVDDLRITNWKADRMDGYFHTVKSKGVKQTISQRAIDNISSIGGIQGALSRSFLRFFDYFKYKEIGIGCKLRNSICEMRGIDDSKTNYQLVQGKGMPSINIIGYRRFIDWEIFLDRLLNAGY